MTEWMKNPWNKQLLPMGFLWSSFHGESSSIPYFIGMSQYDALSFSCLGGEHSTVGQVIRELVPGISSHATLRKHNECLSPHRSMGRSVHTQNKHSWDLPPESSSIIVVMLPFQQCVQELSRMVLRPEHALPLAWLCASHKDWWQPSRPYADELCLMYDVFL